ncbi:MAG: hypothetical protein IIY55_04980, partial [Blautia sp.]|nr:hypothetical protein [Blautia sp.]
PEVKTDSISCCFSFGLCGHCQKSIYMSTKYCHIAGKSSILAIENRKPADEGACFHSGLLPGGFRMEKIYMAGVNAIHSADFIYDIDGSVMILIHTVGKHTSGTEQI